MEDVTNKKSTLTPVQAFLKACNDWELQRHYANPTAAAAGTRMIVAASEAGYGPAILKAKVAEVFGVMGERHLTDETLKTQLAGVKAKIAGAKKVGVEIAVA